MDEAAEPTPGTTRAVHGRLLEYAERTPDFIGITDDAGNVVYVNPATRKRLGLTADEPLHLTTADLFPPSAFDVYYDHVRPALLANGVWTGEIPVLMAGGESMDVEMTIVAGVRPGGVIGWLATVARDLTDLRRAEEELRRQSLYDDLTGVARRALLHDRIDLALRRIERDGGVAAVVFLDVDHLKAINDSFGHQAGDTILIETARRLTRVVRAVDTVARVGGDEFVVLLDGVQDEREAVELANRLQDLLEHEPVQLGDGSVRMSVSVGVAVGQAGVTAEQLLGRADVAMYESKSDRKNRLVAAERRAIRSTGSDRGPSAHELAVALTQRRVTADLDPVVDLRTGAVIGYQALARWRRAEGVMRAEDFVHLAEGSGMSVALDLAVLRGSAGEVLGLGARTARLYVHLSARFLAEPRMGYLVAEVLDDALLPPDRLYVEIHEQLVARRTPGVLDAIGTLRDLGAHVVVSDVGAHSPAIIDLADGRVESLRISRPVVAGLVHDAALTRTAGGVIGLGHGLDLDVIAVGVETAAQRDLLVSLGCDLGEGVALATPSA